ncbi:MAG TPA: archaeosortase/exosortase family protein [Ferruginibacter sp.]|nr:archaeosortase/exosortase family protein [Ferruginibacter sp.]
MYFGTLAFIGITSPGGYYFPFIDNYLNYVSWLRFALLYSSQLILSLFGYNTFLYGKFILRMQGGSGVQLVYSCLGFGIMSFWIAFIFANKTSWQKKTKWIIAGLALIFFINVIRISLLLVAINKKWSIGFNLDNHTLFNIAAYVLIFIMIYFFDRSERNPNTV